MSTAINLPNTTGNTGPAMHGETVSVDGQQLVQQVVQVANLTALAGAAGQDVANEALASLDAKTPALLAGRMPVVLPNLKTLLDEASQTISYFCEAAAGSSTAAAVWRVTRIQVSGSVTTFSPAGTGAFDQVADNRAALSY